MSIYKSLIVLGSVIRLGYRFSKSIKISNEVLIIFQRQNRSLNKMTGETRACQISTTHMAERGSILFDCALQTPCQILSPNVIACDQPDKV